MHTRSKYRKPERGAGRLRALVWLAILAGLGYVAVKVTPVLYNEYLFQDAMQTTARMATVTRQSPENILNSLLVEAQKEDIPVYPEDIHVTSSPGKVSISADYSVTVDLGPYQWTLNFHPAASNNNLL